MYRIVPIPNTPYKAIWDTVIDQFLKDDNGDQAWEDWRDICIRGEDSHFMEAFEERMARIWGTS